MTDLEITRLCAKAMGVRLRPDYPTPQYWAWWSAWSLYDPLHDDAQAMALVKKLHLTLDSYSTGAFIVGSGWNEPFQQTENSDLNRAICECVATMQAAKGGA